MLNHHTISDVKMMGIQQPCSLTAEAIREFFANIANKKIAFMILEACVETFEEALKAQNSGAHRIELCSHLELDGLTPKPELIRKACSELDIPVMVMIRPRGGNFVYSGNEVQIMEQEIAMAKSLGANGIVLGLLAPDDTVDVINTRRLTEMAYPLPVTFHKAIDMMKDPAEGVKQLTEIGGITRILTSGGKPTALEGVSKIREMMEVAQGKIIMLVAGRVTPDNREEIIALTGASELHGRRITGDTGNTHSPEIII
jgi:copper homeostasis protein